MAQCVRNGPCGCGSGRKAKRCCGVRRGPSPAELDRAFLAEQRRRAALRLVAMAVDELRERFDEMIDLPARHVSLQLRLPRLLGPELEALREAIDEHDEEAVDSLLDVALASFDDPGRRAELARAVLALADSGRVAPDVAAVAMVDLTATPSALLRRSLLQALAVSVGAARTPAGLLVVSR